MTPPASSDIARLDRTIAHKQPEPSREETAHRAIADLVKALSTPEACAEREARIAADEQRQRDQAKAMQADRRRQSWKKAGIPHRYVDPFKFDESSPWAAKFHTLRDMQGSGYIVVLLGDRGTGKTRMAVELIRHRIGTADDHKGLYADAIDVFMSIRDCYGDSSRTEQAAVERFVRPAVLVVDEAHERGGSEWEGRILTAIVNKRYAQHRDTILIANTTREVFAAAIGPSIMSRLTETGGVITCDWPSYRTA